jgi:two-component system, sensor histidine kinase YesM
MRSIFSLKTLKRKFLAAMLILTFVPIIIQTVTSMRTSMGIVETNYIDAHISSLNTSGKNMDLILEPILSINRRLLSDTTMMGIFRELLVKTNMSSYDSINIERSFSSIISQNRYIDSLFFISNNNQIYYYTKNSSFSERIDRIDIEKLKKEKWYSETIKADGKEMFFCGDVFNQIEGQEWYFTSTKLIKDPTNAYSNYGIVVMSLRNTMIRHVFPDSYVYDDEKYIIFDKRTGWYFTDDDAENLVEIVEESKKQQAAGNTSKKNKYIISTVKNETTDWELFNVIERSVLSKKSSKIALHSVQLSVAMLIVIIILLVLISDAINKPVKKLSKLIDDFASGDRNLSEEFDDSEIGRIGNQFKLVVTNNIELNERLMLSRVKQREAEIMALQEQINPHFLYNTLDSLYWMAAINEQQEIAQMVVSLSSIFKLTLNNGEMLIEIGKEIEHIDHYLRIQKMRYGDRLKTFVEVEEEILGLRVLNLIIQPIVENAICHGIEPKLGGGTVWVNGRREGELLIFSVKDNGVGMDMGSADKGFGILNVKERIQLFYGQDSDLKISSEKGKGTEVTIIVKEISGFHTMEGQNV